LHPPAPPGQEPSARRLAPDQLSSALVHAELERLAASAAFSRSPRHLRFLRHLVDAVLRGDTGRLREMALGVDVFYRSESRFDPRQDSIVRVEARRLRQKLARYYAQEGQDVRLVFALPVGSYVLEIRHRAPVPPSERHRVSLGVYALSAEGLAPGMAALAPILSAELVGALSRLNGLRVVALAGVAPESDSGELQRTAMRIQVASLAWGTMSRQAGVGPWRLEMRLVRAADLRVTWQRETLADDAELMAALEALARGIIAELHREAAQHQLQRITLSGSHPMLPGLASGAPSAHTLERLALARVAMRGQSPENLRKASLLCEEALSAAPHCAPAYALLAETLLGSVGLTALPSLPTMETARRAAQRAIEIDPGLSDAHGLLGQIHLMLDHDWQRCEAAMLTALRLAPGSATVHARYGWLLMMNRRFDEAHASYAEARDLDPLSLRYRAHDALASLYEGHWEAAAAGLEDVLEVAPDDLVARALRAALHLYAGEVDAGLAAYTRLAEQFPKLSIGRCGLAQAHALRGDTVAARHELAHLQAIFELGYLSPYQIAMVHARLGDFEATMHWLGESARLCDFNYACVAVDPAFRALHGCAGFQQLLRATGRAHLVS
jgi:TolB-like protein/Flp pilus assembly protein TadD